ncbi:PREDICTED: protein MKS1-like [Ipomoea nil]|uniref:protein MKS1-like n=1 Tax=Ipomoea nil TaxID=35883 RepID=UPI000901BABE|nr:PREDICTED: protein MKS1-like [Ipomoea nil]
MDMSDMQSEGKSPRRELQGPRPAPLRVRKDSHKIRKPPVAPSQHPPPQAPPRPPVIIYTVSPKIIHANPSEFMSLVQRLTGPDHSTFAAAASSSSSSIAAASSSWLSAAAFQDNFNVGGGGAVSPAARFASVERTRTPQGKKQPIHDVTADIGMVEGMEISSDVERSVFFPGVLSPSPSSLPPIPPNFFSPPSSDQNPLGFFPDFISPGLHTNNRNSLETNLFMPSPSTINSFISPGRFLISPGTPSLDFFNNIFDL